MKFNAPGLYSAEATATANQLPVRALLFYEGEQTNSAGKTRTFSAADIEAMAIATNQLLARQRIRFFTDHSYSQDGVLGAIEQGASVTAEPISATPQGGMDELIGKMGLFATVTIAGEANIAKYNDGLIKEISVGHDADGEIFGIPMAIYELSAVGIPALTAAALYSMPLSIGAVARDRERGEELWRLWDMFTDAKRNIATATEEELNGVDRDQLLAAAIDDLTALLKASLLPGSQAPPVVPTLPTVPLFAKSMELTQEQYDELKAQADRATALETENAELKTAQINLATFGKLVAQADQLKNDGKLTPAAYNAMGFGDRDKILSAADAAVQLAKLEIQLDTIATYAAPVKMGSHLSGEPLADGPNSGTDEDAQVATYMKSYTPVASWR